MCILLLTLALMVQPVKFEYNGIYVSMDGCIPCMKLHNETEKDVSKYVAKHRNININHFEDNVDRKLIEFLEVKLCPTFLVFKKIDNRNVYIGRIEGYMSTDEFFESIEEIKVHAEKHKTDIVIRGMQ